MYIHANGVVTNDSRNKFGRNKQLYNSRPNF